MCRDIMCLSLLPSCNYVPFLLPSFKNTIYDQEYVALDVPPPLLPLDRAPTPYEVETNPVTPTGLHVEADGAAHEIADQLVVLDFADPTVPGPDAEGDAPDLEMQRLQWIYRLRWIIPQLIMAVKRALEASQNVLLKS